MSPGPLLFNREEDQGKNEQQLRDELALCRARIAALTGEHAERNQIADTLNCIAQPLLALDDKARITYANVEAEGLFGSPDGGLAGKSLWDVYPSGREQLFGKIYEKAAKKREPSRFREPGKLMGKWYEVCFYPAERGMAVLFYDITSREQIEAVFQLALKLINNLKENIFLMRADGRLFHVNEETSAALSYAKADLIRMNITDLVPPEHMGEWRGILERIKQQGSMTFESVLKARDGRAFPVEVYANYFYLHGASYYAISARDITERKRVEEALIAAEDFNRSVLDALPSNIAVLDGDGSIIYVNKGWIRFASENNAGSGDTTGIGINYFDVCRNAAGMHAEEAPASLDGMMSVMTGKSDLFEMEYPCHSPDTRRWFQMRVTPFQGRKQRGIVVYHNDITARKIVEEALRESESSLKRAEEIALIGHWSWDLTTNRISWSDETYIVWGFTPGDVLPSYDLVVSYVHPDDREFFARAVNASIHENRPLSIDFRITRPDGSVAHIHNEAEIMQGPDGRPFRMFGTAQDITRRKTAEDALQVAKAQAELYVDLMGHDINNMNHIAMASLEMAIMELEQDGTLDASGKPFLEKSMESLTSSSQLIRNVQTLQQVSSEGDGLEAINATALLESIIREFLQASGKKLNIDFCHTDDCTVGANVLLKDVFVNLIGNAIKHSRADQSLDIGIFADNFLEGGKKYCRFTIEDNGPGIPDRTKEKLFNRFARGQTKARGSGLGLYLVRTLVEHYGGTIAVEDRVPGDYTRGVKFVLEIPSAG